MAGIVDTTLTNDQTVQGYEQQAEALDTAREDLRGMQKGVLKDLFDYDKSLSDRYSSPDSKMYLENAADRERAISGYSQIARGEVSNLYDIMEGVSKAKQDLLTRVEMLKEQAKKASASGAGQTMYSPSAILSAIRGGASGAGTPTEQPPEPPQKLVQETLADPTKKIYWLKNDNGTYAYTVDNAMAPRKETAELYTEYKDPETAYKEQQAQEDEILDMFGVDKEQLSKLAALEVLDPKAAQAAMQKLIVENATATPKELTADEYKAGVKPTDNRKVRQQKMETYYASPESMDASQQKDYNFQRSAILNAKKLQELYAQRRAGQVSESDFKIKSTNYATSLARAILRKESGATITMPEWQSVFPSVPKVDIRNQNAFERITGQTPGVTRIVEGEKSALTKLDDFLEEQYTLNPRLRTEFEKGQQGLPIEDNDVKGKLIQAGVVYADDGSIDWSQMPEGSFDELPLGQKIPKAAYSLILEPVIKGMQGYAQLVGTAGIAGVDALNKALGGDGILDDINPDVKEWYIDNITNNYATPQQTLLTGGLQTLGGIGAGVDIFTLGKGTAAKQLGKTILKMGARNMAINAPLFGIGSALEAMREGEDAETTGKRFIEGTTGQRFTGPFVGAFGRNSTTEAADVVATIAGPIIGGKLIEKFFTGKALSTPDNDGFKAVEQNITDMPDHEVAFAQAMNKGDTNTARQIMDGLSDGNPYKKIYKQSLIEAENVGTTGSGAFKNIFQSVKQRMAGSLFTYDPESVTKSEQYAEKAIAQTKSKTLYGIAKELPQVKSKAGNFVDSHVSQVDKVIGPQSLDDVMGGIMDKVGETSAAQANPTQLDVVRSLLRKMLYSGQPGMDTPEMQGGATTLTTLERMNNARKALNKSINSSWFSNGMPTASKTENLNAMKWTASCILKDMIKESDPTGNIGRAIESEHIAFAVEPVISKLVQGKSSKIGGSGISLARLGYLIDNLFNTVWEPIRIGAVRSMTSSGLKEFRQGLDQLPTGGMTPAAQVGTEAQGFTQKPLQPEMIDIIASNKAKKAPAQATRYLGEQAENLVGTRAQQDKALRRLKSIKYK